MFAKWLFDVRWTKIEKTEMQFFNGSNAKNVKGFNTLVRSGLCVFCCVYLPLFYCKSVCVFALYDSVFSREIYSSSQFAVAATAGTGAVMSSQHKLAYTDDLFFNTSLFSAV